MASDPSTPVYSRTPEGAFYIDSQSGLQLVTDPNTLTGLETGQGQQGSIPYTQETSDTLQSPPASQNRQSGIDTSNPQNIFLLSMMNMLRQAQQAGTPTNLISQQTALQQLQNNTNANPTTFGGGSLAGLPYSEIQQIESANANLYTPEQDVVSNAIKEQDARLQTFNTLFNNADTMGKEVLDQMTPPQDIINGLISQIESGIMPTGLTTGAQNALNAAMGKDPTIMTQYFNALIAQKNLQQKNTPGQNQPSNDYSSVPQVMDGLNALGIGGNSPLHTALASVPGGDGVQKLAQYLINAQGPNNKMLSSLNNPGGIKSATAQMLGLTDWTPGTAAQDGGTFAKFDNPEDGANAVTQDINYYTRQGQDIQSFIANYLGVSAPAQSSTSPTYSNAPTIKLTPSNWNKISGSGLFSSDEIQSLKTYLQDGGDWKTYNFSPNDKTKGTAQLQEFQSVMQGSAVNAPTKSDMSTAIQSLETQYGTSDKWSIDDWQTRKDAFIAQYPTQASAAASAFDAAFSKPSSNIYSTIWNDITGVFSKLKVK